MAINQITQKTASKVKLRVPKKWFSKLLLEASEIAQKNGKIHQARYFQTLVKNKENVQQERL